VEELITLIDSSYRTRAEACWGCRCGGQSLAFGLGHSDIFGWVGAFSSAVFETFHDRLHADLALLWIGCGHDDFLYQQNTRFIARMNALDVQHVAHITVGGHSWPLWHSYLREFASRRFQTSPT
jgi:enterochelin esterase family protein